MEKKSQSNMTSQLSLTQYSSSNKSSTHFQGDRFIPCRSGSHVYEM